MPPPARQRVSQPGHIAATTYPVSSGDYLADFGELALGVVELLTLVELSAAPGQDRSWAASGMPAAQTAAQSYARRAQRPCIPAFLFDQPYRS